jgi:hypothetical protein
MARKYTNMLYEMVDNVMTACLKYMSEDDVKDMMEYNGFIDDNEESDEEE